PVPPVRRSDQPQLAALLGFAEKLLVVCRLVAELVGKHPDLVQVHRLRLRRIELAVRHSGSRAHVLHVARLDHRPVPHAVLVLQRSFEHVRDDLHVAVRVRPESAAARNPVVVHYPQRPELLVVGIVVIRERERVPRVQPAVVGVPAFFAPPNRNHVALLALMPPLRHYSRCNDYCQEEHKVARLIPFFFRRFDRSALGIFLSSRPPLTSTLRLPLFAAWLPDFRVCTRKP